MNDRILYAGDTHLASAAAYLAGVLTHAGLPFDYVAGDAPFARPSAGAGPRSYIISDYPVKNWTDADFRRVADDVEAGSGLLMIGGWESFHGAAGEYHRSPLADLLPVVMQDTDDRVNAPQPCFVEKRAGHPVLDGLPFEHPPCIGGYNRVGAKPDAEVVLSAQHFAVELSPRDGTERDVAASAAPEEPSDPSDPAYTFTRGDQAPLLVVGRHGRGRTAAFTSDVAPHWVGGLVDWGPERVRVRAHGADEIEVGSHYVEFFTRLVRWTMGDDPSGR